jgi:hypothetical protein
VGQLAANGVSVIASAPLPRRWAFPSQPRLVPLYALLRILREHLAINRASAEHVPNGVTDDRIGHANDSEARSRRFPHSVA